MSQMSPLAAFLLRILRVACLGSAAIVAAVIGIEAWRQGAAGGMAAMTRPDYGFLAILAVMFVGFLWLARAITRELVKAGP